MRGKTFDPDDSRGMEDDVANFDGRAEQYY